MTCWPEAGVTNNGLFKINIAKIVVVAISHQPGNTYREAIILLFILTLPELEEDPLIE